MEQETMVAGGVTHSYLKLLVHVNENMHLGCVCGDIVCSMFVHMEGEGGHIYFVWLQIFMKY